MTTYKIGQIIDHNGDTWEVVNVGWTGEDGRTYIHLLSTTRFVMLRNGKHRAMTADWF